MPNINDDELRFEYRDTDGDKIKIEEEEDLLMSFKWALKNANGNLNIKV